ncbi:uncharacterized protein LOC135400672 isoform X2 [Ornithodoros turicata]|uniref:uncharacterized protein LOC135400672 isoform X2 n=1 Tax=Ornithodoros turicata TaxID=34597 RepID=UPI003139064C
MPTRCCVPRCRGNFTGGPRVRVFSFPVDEPRRGEWIRQIRRKDFTPIKSSKVCERHFEKRYLLTTSRYEDKRTGRVLEAPLSNARLAPDAVPTIFPERSALCNRTLRLPAAQNVTVQKLILVPAAIQPRLTVVQAPQQEAKASPVVDAFGAIQKLKTSNFWTVISTDARVMFLHVVLDGCPTIKYSVVVEKHLTVKFFMAHAQMFKVGDYIVPSLIKDHVDVTFLLDKVEKFDETAKSFSYQDKVNMAVPFVLSTFNMVKREAPEEQADTLDFLCEQIRIFQTQSPKYSSTLLVFACLLYTLSSQAYNFLRNSSGLTLPHPTTVRRICPGPRKDSKDLGSKKSETHLLSYIRERVKHLAEHQRVVTLQMDEIELKEYCTSKAKSGSPEPITSVHVFMLQSVLTDNREVVHVLPVTKQTGVDELHSVVKKLILGLEKQGLTVIAVIADNNPTYKLVMSNFATPSPKLDIVYPHPTNCSRPLFFIIDPVHLLKCVRNNWICNQNLGRHLTFPDFGTTISAFKARDALTASYEAVQKFQNHQDPNMYKPRNAAMDRTFNPTRLERQSAEKLFATATAHALRAEMKNLSLEYAAGTATFVEIIAKWWSVVNVRTVNDTRTSQNELQSPITSMEGPQIEFLSEFIDWLDAWEEIDGVAGRLERDTCSALHLTCYSLIELTRYCLEELRLGTVLLGKFQTDRLQDRFGSHKVV